MTSPSPFQIGQTYPTRDGGTCKILGVKPNPSPEDGSAMVGRRTFPDWSGVSWPTYYLDGRHSHFEDSAEDLIAPEPTFTLDEPVMVRDRDGQLWERRYYARPSEDGRHFVWEGGCTSWSVDGRDDVFTWAQCRRPTADELKSRA